MAGKENPADHDSQKLARPQMSAPLKLNRSTLTNSELCTLGVLALVVVFMVIPFFRRSLSNPIFSFINPDTVFMPLDGQSFPRSNKLPGITLERCSLSILSVPG